MVSVKEMEGGIGGGRARGGGGCDRGDLDGDDGGAPLDVAGRQ